MTRAGRRAPITVVGGGLAGLTAAIACAEAGAVVNLHEAHRRLGGRARATAPPHVAHDGAHVFYADGPHYRWLAARGFVSGLGWPTPRTLRLRFRTDGELRRTPPPAMLRALVHARLRAPVDRDFRGWAAERWGSETAEHLAAAISVTTYDADTGRLGAAFVWDLVQRVLGPRPPAVRYVRGGWQTVVDRMAARARELGVAVETQSRVTELPGDGPVVVATELAAARTLLADPDLRAVGGRCVLLDLAVRADRRDHGIVFDLDAGGFAESYTMPDPTVAPPGESLFQLQMPIRGGESRDDARQRLRAFADQVVPGWTDRVTFRRAGSATLRTGALDLPGHTWRDRPAIARGHDVFLAGDMVAAPGMRGEIAINSAIEAASGALHAVGLCAPTAGSVRRPRRRSGVPDGRRPIYDAL